MSRYSDRGTCSRAGCQASVGLYMTQCFDHAFANATFREVVEDVPRADKPVRSWDVICMMCADRRTARGTDDQARETMAHLPPCARCGGPLIVENSDVGAISSSSAGHVAIHKPGYGVSTRPKAAA